MVRLIDLLESPGNYGEELENCQNARNFLTGIARFVEWYREYYKI